MKCACLLLSIILGIVFANTKNAENPQVEVRAVFINCEPDERENLSIDNEATRFEREELFKHSVLQDCIKKIALTVKVTSEPNMQLKLRAKMENNCAKKKKRKFEFGTIEKSSIPIEQNSGDEYIPIEHVFRGKNKRVRLLDPYVLRLRRETPLQAYKLRRMASVNGVLANTNDDKMEESKDMEQKLRNRSKRSLNPHNLSTGKNQNCENITSNSLCSNKRDKRHEYNIIVEDAIDEEKIPRWNNKDHFIQDLDKKERDHNTIYESSKNPPSDKMVKTNRNIEDTRIKSNTNEGDRLDSWSSNQNSKEGILKSQRMNANDVKSQADLLITDKRKVKSEYNKHNRKDEYASSEEEYDMYEIGNPDLLYVIQVQLFEKLTAADGNTVWNDMTKGESASVSTLAPEWIRQDMNIRYRPTEWIPREEFSLPSTSMCLLTPLSSKNLKLTDSDNVRANEPEKFIVVPKEDILGLERDDNSIQKRDSNSIQIRDSNTSDVQHSPEKNEQYLRRVTIRTSRAIFSGKEEKLNIVLNGDEEFLTLPLHRPFHAQIDLEARADENQLVPIGSSGRIMTVVADSSRRTRTTLTVQVTNTGLAAARFRVLARDCGPEWMDSQNNNVGETFSDGPTLLPPRHTRSIRLDVPSEMSAEKAHCIVSLVNNIDEPVAVRDVTIKKGDRCFCVWHCECVCLSEDPKLICREMTEARQMAAGLSMRERVRRARSVCYHDVVSINMLVTAFGVITTLLFFGLVKAVLGLCCGCIGSWGLHRLVEMPRKLEHYYESSLRDNSVDYDSEGWPVHPNTKERTVRLVSKPMEFILNVIFFVSTPCIIIYDILKEIYYRFKNSEESSLSWHPNEKDKNCYSSHDIQGSGKRSRLLRRRRRGIKKWMTPEAEDLSHNIWQGVVPGENTVGHMRPLLCDEFCSRDEKSLVQHACDSEGDDTEYVLMQMKKSMESLAKSQRKLNGSEK